MKAFVLRIVLDPFRRSSLIVLGAQLTIRVFTQKNTHLLVPTKQDFPTFQPQN
jgi:hypothetical protein